MLSTERTTDPSQMAEAVEAIEAIADLNPGSLVLVQIEVLTIHSESAKLMARNVSTATKRALQPTMSFQTMWKVPRVEKSNQ